MKHTQSEIEEAKKALQEVLKAGDTVYTILRHVSSSGMSRVIDLVVIVDGKPHNISYYAGIVLGLNRDKRHDGLKVGGCGMDMGFHVVYSLASVLFGRGAEAQAHGYHTGRNGMTEAETDGGYLLNQSWL